ncbi:MAG: dethiobiotin synthase [Gammaproteobacteria bacterium]|nr:dethiobiotin synthase [Gammaproteobacteria bacterium]MCP4089507.1 dethiobiotin synthase [Gammaproteobacteria bacterium]MCP4276213.1 dethiobiotin synthase [Gammaproteobacteria bacterium]MCP4832910.1 dethiobiotin synthase [Gammaproteobacteria bacterium]MCP4930035.1 dethiobiotin synthase [Gammaproteobacteria bacterium]
MNNTFFITGTDTNVGKTHVATLLLEIAHARGLSTLGLKPVSAGCIEHDGQLVNQDAWDLLERSSIKPDYAEVNPVALSEAMAPHIAAEQEGKLLNAGELAAHCRQMSKQAEFVVIEGAGGWQVPINTTETMADIAVSIGCPVVLIVGIRLGCLNHALLSAEAIQNSGLRLAGWVANLIDNDMAVASENITALEQRLHAPCIGTLPLGHDTHKYIDLDLLLSRPS